MWLITSCSLWRGEETRPLTRKAFAALRYLVAHAGQLVTKEELIEAVWAVPYVSDTAIAACIREIRRALDEQAQAPQFVETVRGRGYRFLAAVTVETRPVAAVGADGGGAVGVPPLSLPTPRHNLPAPPTVFIGRETEVAEIRGLLLEEPDCRLLTLVGPGGIGKTRLALKVAETLLATQTEHGTFAQGIVFVPLEAVPAASGIVTAILSVLAEESGFAIQATASLQVQLLDFLRAKALLLILDNAEHLVGEADVLAEILATAPGVKILVTSRVALNIQEEWFHPLTGMAYPQAGDMQDMALAAYDAVCLFAHHARQARSDFSLAVEFEHVLRICRLVDGTPLAIELAAAWLKGLPCQQIVCELERGLDILTARHQNIPMRHRSMRTVLEQSWRLLAPEEQDVLTHLSVLQGGFTQDAARVIAGASPFILTLLVEKSMVRMTTPGRYQMHALLRQFATEQFQDAWSTHDAYSRYFVTFAQQCYTCFLDKRYPEVIKALSDERDNLRAAWQWLMEQIQTEPQSAGALERLGQRLSTPWPGCTANVRCTGKGKRYFEPRAQLSRQCSARENGQAPRRTGCRYYWRASKSGSPIFSTFWENTRRLIRPSRRRCRSCAPPAWRPKKVWPWKRQPGPTSGVATIRRRKPPPSAAWLWRVRLEMSCRPWMPSCSWPEPRPMKATTTWPSGCTSKPPCFIVS
jgi:predicted ATPase